MSNLGLKNSLRYVTWGEETGGGEWRLDTGSGWIFVYILELLWAWVRWKWWSILTPKTLSAAL